MITKQEIDAFLAVAQSGSISGAAETLFITQPALSRRIRSIEEDLGCSLFERGRGTRSTNLTPHGKAFLPVARKWLEAYDEAISIKDALERPQLKISSVGSVRSFLMQGILRDATRDEAPYLVDFNLCHSTEAPLLVETGRTDVALVDLLQNPGNLPAAVIATPVYSVPFVLIGGPSWKNVESISASKLNAKREIRLPWNYSFDIWHDRYFGAGVNALVRLDSAASIEHVLRDDLFCILPKTEAIRVSDIRNDVFVVDLVDGPPDETIHLLTSPTPGKEEKLAYFIALLKQNLSGAQSIATLI